MLAFAEGEFDVLVCTTIIESGLDIPNANTIIINRADRFGLAQLYQLRGRVGRGAVRAYAYLLHDRNQHVVAGGARPAGGIAGGQRTGRGLPHRHARSGDPRRGRAAGPRQHGHIAAVGFDLYCRLLAKAVEDLKEGKERETREGTELREIREMRERAEGLVGGGGDQEGARATEAVSYDDPMAPAVTLDLPLLAIIPEDYVEDLGLRLRLYRRIAGLTGTAEIDKLADELIDRFGTLPEEVENLLFQVRIKVLALRAGVTAIGRDNDQLVLKSDALEQVDRARLQVRLGEMARVARRAVWMPLGQLDEEEWQENLERTLRAIYAAHL